MLVFGGESKERRSPWIRSLHVVVSVIRFSNSALKCFNWFKFLIYPRYIRETLATFLCCTYCGLCESLVRFLRRFFSHKLRVFKEKIFLYLDDHSSCCHWSLKKTQAGVLVFWWRIQKKKESVDSELARGRVSKFYWWIAIRSRVWGLVSLIVWTSILSR